MATDDFVGFIHSHKYDLGGLKVEIKSGTVSCGMRVETVGDCEFDGYIDSIYVEKSNTRVEEASVGDTVFIIGNFYVGSTLHNVCKGSYMIPKGKTQSIHQYTAINMTGTPEREPRTFLTIPAQPQFLLQLSIVSGIPVGIARKGQEFVSNVQVPVCGEIDVKIKCWHPWPEFDIINHRGAMLGKVYLNGHHTKSAKKV